MVSSSFVLRRLSVSVGDQAEDRSPGEGTELRDESSTAAEQKRETAENGLERLYLQVMQLSWKSAVMSLQL